MIMLVILISKIDSSACVTFVINSKDSLVFGWNYEIDCGSGFIIVNKKGLHKTSFVPPNEKPAEWVSKYGSLSFNQWGREFPAGGINEKGLVVVQTTYVKTKFPDQDNRPSLSELQWIQYQLDNSSTLQQVLESDKVIRISKNSVPLHFMICDKEGNKALIEFIDGNMVVYKNNDFLYSTMGNDSYETSKSELIRYQGFGGSELLPENSNGSKCANFIIASDFVKSYKNQYGIIDYSFNALAHSSEAKRTQWSVVFDVKNQKIHFKSLSSRIVKTINVSNFDYTCNTSIKFLDISANSSSDFSDYTTEIDKEYILRAYNDPGIPWIREMIPAEVNDYKIEYVKTIKCK